MNRRKQDANSVRISDEEYTRLENKLEVLRNEFTACKRKLSSKCEALLILSQELDQCRSERDQFKLMAEQLRERCQSLKKSLSGQPLPSSSETGILKKYTAAQSQNLVRQLYECKECNKSLQFEVDDLKQKLQDANGDIKLLREQIIRSRIGTTDEGMSTPRHFPAHEREELVQKLETANEQYSQLERDLQTVLDEKEELVTERDVYKTKYERLNQELNYILKGDENRVVDIDALIMENKYLQERLKQMEEEKSMAMAAVSKYKSLIEKKKTKSSLKLGQSRGGGMIITQKQVQQVLESKQSVMPTQQAMSDLQALAGALLDSVNDKNLALSHQRKTNKILGNRVAELEKKLKTLECAGLWNIPAHVSSSLEKLKQECDNVKTLIPRKVSNSDSEKLTASEGDHDSELETVTPLDSLETSPTLSPPHTATLLNHLELTDLDLLPTKEVTTRPQNKSFPEFQDQQFLAGFTDAKATFSDPAYEVKRTSSVTINSSSQSDRQHGCVLNLNQGATVHADSSGVEALDKQNNSFEESETPLSDDDDDDDDGDDGLSPKVMEDAEGSDEHTADVGDTEELDVDSTDHDDELDKFYGDADQENSEKVGLLLEKVAQKMCNIKQSDKGAGDGSGDSGDRDVIISQKKNDVDFEQSERSRSVRTKKLSTDIHTVDSPLLEYDDAPKDDENGAEETSDKPHNIEC